MEKLTRLHVPPEWEHALIACLDTPPPRPRDRRVWIACLLFVLAALAVIAAWFLR